MRPISKRQAEARKAPQVRKVPKGIRELECYQGKLILVQYGNAVDAESGNVVYKGQHKGKLIQFDDLHPAREFAAQNGYSGIIVESGRLRRS